MFAMAAVLFGASACVPLGPRFTPEVASSFVRDDMRRMETEHLVVYYPAHARERSLEIASRLDACVIRLRARVASDTPRPKVVALLTSSEFNNAFVRPRAAGMPLESVLPLQMGVELFNLFDLGAANLGDIACHEAVHYVHLEQTDGPWGFANDVFGDLISPNLLLESWFIEGLATWLEGSLGHRAGRPHSPVWTNAFLSGVSSEGGAVPPARLHPEDRRLLPWGPQYLAGGAFIEWLAETHGEDKLWALIERQGRALLFPFGVSLRFETIYGKPLDALLDDFEAHLRQTLPHRVRGGDQRVVVEDVGFFARLASGPKGELAVLWDGLDQPTALEVREPDGTLRYRRGLARVLPGRPWIIRRPTSASGLSFSPDGARIYVFSEELDHDGGSTYELRAFDAASGRHQRSWKNLRGMGGGPTPDGRGYVFVRMIEGRSELARLDLETGSVETLTALHTGDSLGPPAVSPDGTQIAFARRETHGFDLWLREADGALRRLTHDGRFNQGPRWVDAQRIVHLREEDGRAEVFLLDVETGQRQRVTQVPWGALDPSPMPGGTVAFLNRDGWRWTVDAVPWRAREGWDDPPATLPPPSERTDAPAEVASLRISSDAPYSPFDELFVPRLRGPSFVGIMGFGGEVYPNVALGAVGFDRLGWHTWQVILGYDAFTRAPYGQLGWGTSLLAPWFLSATASHQTQLALLRPAGLAPDERATAFDEVRHHDLQVSLRASRPIYALNVSFGLEGLQRTRQVDRAHDVGLREDRRVRLLGPGVFAGWAASEATPYAGARRGLSASLALTAFPRALGSDVNLGDGRAEVGAVLPLPLSRRHTLSLSLRGRAVVGPERGLLQVGGLPSTFGYTSADPREQEDRPSARNAFLPPIAFSEPARGFEDVAFQASRVGLLGARYRYPIPIDRGSTSTLWLFSSLFVRQVELEGFFEGLRTDVREEGPVAALGGSLRVRLTYASAARFSLLAQAAWRTRPDLPVVYMVGVAAD